MGEMVVADNRHLSYFNRHPAPDYELKQKTHLVKSQVCFILNRCLLRRLLYFALNFYIRFVDVVPEFFVNELVQFFLKWRRVIEFLNGR